jgi:hypothetical protein
MPSLLSVTPAWPVGCDVTSAATTEDSAPRFRPRLAFPEHLAKPETDIALRRNPAVSALILLLCFVSAFRSPPTPP